MESWPLWPLVSGFPHSVSWFRGSSEFLRGGGDTVGCPAGTPQFLGLPVCVFPEVPLAIRGPVHIRYCTVHVTAWGPPGSRGHCLGISHLTFPICEVDLRHRLPRVISEPIKPLSQSLAGMAPCVPAWGPWGCRAGLLRLQFLFIQN